MRRYLIAITPMLATPANAGTVRGLGTMTCKDWLLADLHDQAMFDSWVLRHPGDRCPWIKSRRPTSLRVRPPAASTPHRRRPSNIPRATASSNSCVTYRATCWNSTYIADAVAHLRFAGEVVPEALLAHTTPLSWEHIGLSGDFLWDRAAATADKRRSLNVGRTRAAA
jgi:Tn3 transposase DDE domain